MNDRIARHYQGDRAGAYFRYQEPLAELFGEIGAQKFQPYSPRGDFVIDFGAGAEETFANRCPQVEPRSRGSEMTPPGSEPDSNLRPTP